MSITKNATLQVRVMGEGGGGLGWGYGRGIGGHFKPPIMGSRGNAPGSFSYWAVSLPWNSLICNDEKLPIKVFDNLYPHGKKVIF